MKTAVDNQLEFGLTDRGTTRNMTKAKKTTEEKKKHRNLVFFKNAE